jgi:hypothetical protein
MTAPVEDLSAGERATCAIKAGALSCWGNNLAHKLGRPDPVTALPVSARIPCD